MRLELFIIFLVISMIFLPIPAFGHKLIQTDGSNNQIEKSLVISDPIVSWAMYEELDGGVLYYTFDAKKNDRLYASIVIPKLSGLEYFSPSLVLLVPSFSIELNIISPKFSLFILLKNSDKFISNFVPQFMKI